MDWILSGIILTTLFILGSFRISACIRAAAVQGTLLSFLPVLIRGSLTDFHGLGMFLGTFSIKAVLIPLLLFRSIRETTLSEETESTASRHLSLLTGGIVTVIAFSWKFYQSSELSTPLVVPTALTMVLLGFLLLASRKKAIHQVIGFLVLENGVFIFGMTLAADFPTTVEIGILLDLLVGIFVMGIMIYHIHRTFDHIDTTKLASLKDTE
jgi:hydrogenase-4 component E